MKTALHPTLKASEARNVQATLSGDYEDSGENEIYKKWDRIVY
jgi:hypothetical protein